MSNAIRHPVETNREILTVPIPDGQSIATTVVETVATVDETAPANLSPRLYDSIDPDALESLCDASADWDHPPRVAFTYAGYEICVVAGHRITVSEVGDQSVQ